MEVEVVGIIALGIQVCGEVNSYIDNCKAAPEELASIAEQLKTWQSLLMTIRELTENDKLHNRQVNQHVQQSMRSVEKRIQAVQKAVRKLGSSKRFEGQDLEVQDDAVAAKVSKKQRLLYGMRRDKIKALMANVNELNNSLTLSLQLYQIEFNARKARDVDTALYDIFTILSSLPKVPIYTEYAIENASENDVDPDISKNCALVSQNSEGTLCEEPQVQGTELAIASSYSDCTCSARRKTARMNKSWGWFSVTTNRIDEIQHEPGCVWTDLPPAKSVQATTVSIRTSAYWRYFATAITASYDRNISILPVVQTFNLRDLSQSPVVQLIDLADLELDDLEWDDPLAEQQARRYWHRRLMELFRNGKASPRDVDYKSNRTILHFLPFPSQHKMRPYTQLTWQTLNKLNFSKNMMLCDGLAPWEYNFSRSVPLAGDELKPDLLPWNADRWLEPNHIPEAVLTGDIDADGKCARAFVLAKVMHTRTSLLETSNVGPLCQAIILHASSKVLQVLEDGISSWEEPFLGEDSGICAIDLAIMWFPELMNSLIHDNADSDKRLRQLRPPRPHPSRLSFLEVAINIGLRHGPQFGEAAEEEYLALIKLALEHDHPIYFHRVAKSLGSAEDIVTFHLADRRRRLLDLAKRRLPQTRLDAPELLESSFVDEQVEPLLQAFAKANVAIPESLRPRNLERDGGLTGSVFEYAWHSEELCVRLEELGFDPEGFIRSRCRDGLFPMRPLLAPLTWDCWKFRWLLRLVSTSTTSIGDTPVLQELDPSVSYWTPKPLQPLPGNKYPGYTHPEVYIPFIHALIAFVGYCVPGKVHLGNGKIGFRLPDPGISALVGTHIVSSKKDNCHCGCAPYGCSPFTIFLRVVMEGVFRREKFELYMDRVRHSIHVTKIALGEASNSEAVVEQMIRLFTFDCLECRHTCCNSVLKGYLYGPNTRSYSDYLDEEEREEILQEDAEQLETMECLVARSMNDFRNGDNDVSEFIEQRWIPSIRQILDEEDQRRMSDAEIASTEDFGVRWTSLPTSSTKSHRDTPYSHYDDVLASVRFDELETDEERMEAVKWCIDQICV